MPPVWSGSCVTRATAAQGSSPGHPGRKCAKGAIAMSRQASPRKKLRRRPRKRKDLGRSGFAPPDSRGLLQDEDGSARLRVHACKRRRHGPRKDQGALLGFAVSLPTGCAGCRPPCAAVPVGLETPRKRGFFFPFPALSYSPALEHAARRTPWPPRFFTSRLPLTISIAPGTSTAACSAAPRGGSCWDGPTSISSAIT